MKNRASILMRLLGISTLGILVAAGNPVSAKASETEVSVETVQEVSSSSSQASSSAIQTSSSSSQASSSATQTSSSSSQVSSSATQASSSSAQTNTTVTETTADSSKSGASADENVSNGNASDENTSNDDASVEKDGTNSLTVNTSETILPTEDKNGSIQEKIGNTESSISEDDADAAESSETVYEGQNESEAVSADIAESDPESAADDASEADQKKEDESGASQTALPSSSGISTLRNLTAAKNTTALNTPLKAPAADGIEETANVIRIGDNLFSSLQAAIEAAQDEDIIVVTKDIDVDTDTNISIARKLTLIGENSAKISFTSKGGLDINGGSLSLGNGLEENNISLIDQRTGNSLDSFIKVRNGGLFTLNDWATVKRESNGTSDLIDVGNDTTENNEKAAVSRYHGEGGSVEGGKVYLETNSESYIKGGTYNNTNSDSFYGQTLDVYGHMTELSGAIITSTNGYRAVDICHGTIDKMTGTDGKPLIIKNQGGNGIHVRYGGYVGTINGNVTIEAGLDNGYEHGHGAIWVGNYTGQDKTGIGRIEGGTFRGSNYGLVLLGDSSAHQATIDEISGGKFYGMTNGLNNNRFATIGKITGGEFYGVEPTYRSEYYNDMQWGGAGMYNFGAIGSIVNAKFFGGNQGAENSNIIGDVSDSSFVSEKDGSEGFYNTFFYDVFNKDNKSAFPDGPKTAWFIGKVKSMNNVTIRGKETGLLNDGGEIGPVSNSIIEATGGAQEYQDRSGNPYYSAGIFNTNGQAATEIVRKDGQYYATKSETRNGTIESLENVKVNLDYDVWYGMRNEGKIGTIKNSAFRGQYAGVVNELGASLEKIESGTFWGYGKADDNAKVYGYLNNSETATQIEPGLTGKVGVGRYWGDTDAVAGNETMSNIVYPEGYHMSARDYRLPSGFVNESTQDFRYLKKPFTLSYDGNAVASTGSVDSQTETADGEKLHAAANAFVRAGWYFTGWNTQADGKGVNYTPFGANDSDEEANGKWLQLLNGDVVLYAQWSPYEVSYDLNGAEGTMEPSGPNDPDDPDATIIISDKDNTIQRDGYIFTGWNTQADGSGKDVNAGDTEQRLTENITLYAQWKPVSKPEPETPDKPDDKPEPETPDTPDDKPEPEVSDTPDVKPKPEVPDTPDSKSEPDTQDQPAVVEIKHVEPADSEQNSQSEIDTPKTADVNETGFYALLLAASGAGVTVCLGKKKKKAKDTQ